MALLAPSPLSAFEQERLDRIAENRRRMGKCRCYCRLFYNFSISSTDLSDASFNVFSEEMGVLETANNLMKTFRPARPPAPKRRSLKVRQTLLLGVHRMP